jgi:tRNA (guanosine-2'-O-)-methyltransferase
MTLERRTRIRTVLEQRQPDLTVLLEQVHKPHNLSAILRSCDAVGVLEAHCVALQGRVPTFNDTSASADKWVPLRVHPDTVQAITTLKARGFQIVATHLSDQSVDYREVDYTVPTCVMLGAERWGLTGEAAQLADRNVIVPMMGMVSSLNVSVAAAVILFEAQRQRARAGMYAAPRLDPDLFARLEYEWLHPREAEHFRSRGEPYPALGPIGTDHPIRPGTDAP